MIRAPSLSEALCSAGFDHYRAPGQNPAGFHRIVDRATGEVVDSLTAHDAWPWLHGTVQGRRYARLIDGVSL